MLTRCASGCHFLLVTACLLGLAVFGVAPSGVVAQGRPASLVCFEIGGLRASLDRVVNAQQFLRNDRNLNSGSCAFAQVPPGSSGRFVEFHRASGGFVFPVFFIRYATTGQKMYAADGIFRMSEWRVDHKCGRGPDPVCLVPRTCEALDGFLLVSNGELPVYMRIPRVCERQVIQ